MPRKTSTVATDPTDPLVPPAPDHWLLLTDDVVCPLQDAHDTLQFIEDLFSAFAMAATADGDGDISFSGASWEVVSALIADKKRMIDATLTRAKRVPGDIVVADERFDGIGAYELFKAREQREAASGAAESEKA